MKKKILKNKIVTNRRGLAIALTVFIFLSMLVSKNLQIQAGDVSEQSEDISISEENIPPLQNAFLADFDEDFIVGAAINGETVDDPVRMEVVTKHFNAVTLENELKPDAMFGYSNSACPGTEIVELNGEELEVPILDYSRAEHILDKILEWNQVNPEKQIKVRGHVLIWHSQTPEWFFHKEYDKTQDYVGIEEMDKRQEWYIKTVLTHFTGPDSKYNGMFYGWDVVNEAVSDTGGKYRNDAEGGGDSLTDDIHNSKSSWWKIYQSSDYIVNAFRYANQYAPADVELYYNDYNECQPSKVKGIVKLLEDVKAAEGTRIDGMGMQGHYQMYTPTTMDIEKAAKKYAEVVDKVQITELDVRASDGFDGSDEKFAKEMETQAKRYKGLYVSMKNMKQAGISVSGMTVWGVSDADSWLRDQSGIGGGNTGSTIQYPLLLDDDCQPKEAFWAIVEESGLEYDLDADEDAKDRDTSEADADSMQSINDDAAGENEVDNATGDSLLKNSGESGKNTGFFNVIMIVIWLGIVIAVTVILFGRKKK
ncbi:MAG: endo-1,4-beta-xylanase [Lachnospiraceae bacterium]|nr:endo-1,4-beta-xylanase [Lachnospiraceae bacterium]